MVGHNNRNVGTRANIAQEIEAFIVAKPDIENDQPGFNTIKMTIQFGSGRRRLDRHTVFFEKSADNSLQRRVAIDYDDVSGALGQRLVVNLIRLRWMNCDIWHDFPGMSGESRAIGVMQAIDAFQKLNYIQAL
jgi:hypothetical protein